MASNQKVQIFYWMSNALFLLVKYTSTGPDYMNKCPNFRELRWLLLDSVGFAGGGIGILFRLQKNPNISSLD